MCLCMCVHVCALSNNQASSLKCKLNLRKDQTSRRNSRLKCRLYRMSLHRRQAAARSRKIITLLFDVGCAFKTAAFSRILSTISTGNSDICVASFHLEHASPYSNHRFTSLKIIFVSNNVTDQWTGLRVFFKSIQSLFDV